MTLRSIMVAAVQPECRPGPVANNLLRIEKLVAQAVSQDAELVLLPERFPEAFQFDGSAWEAASPQEGEVERWLCETALRYRIYLGGSYLEARDEDFYNTFALATPEGRIAGRVGKDHPCSLEAYTFHPQPGSQFIDTELGRIGVAICYDNSLRCVWDRLLAADIDLLLMPMCAPTPQKNLLYGERQIAAYHAAFREGATQTARTFGIPAVMSNKSGPWDTPLPGGFSTVHSSFPGFSHIADGDGNELARLDEKEGVIVARIHLDPARKKLVMPPDRERYRPWISPVPFVFRMFALFEWMGRRSYARNPARRMFAMRASGK